MFAYTTLADVKVGHFVELTFFEGKSSRFEFVYQRF